MERARTAQADAWAAEGTLREPLGGGALTARDIRAMASGLAQPQFNGADVTGPDPDLEAARAFFAARGLALAVRVPSDMPWSRGRRIARLRLMAVDPAGFVPAPPVAGLALREAGPDDLGVVVALDSAAFAAEPVAMRDWLAPHIGAPGFTTALACLDDEPVATAYSVRTDGAAGPALLLAGVAVAAPVRRRGIGAAISGWLLERGFAAGARLAHLHADGDGAARVYGRLGFADAGALDVFVDV